MFGTTQSKTRYSIQKIMKIIAGKVPLEWVSGFHEEILEIVDTFGNRFETGEIVGSKGFPLQDGKVYLNLVEPAGMNRQNHRHRVPELLR